MEPDVIRMFSSSPPPMEDEEDEDEFGDFGTFSALPGSVSFSEFDTPTTFDQNQALTATSPPEVLNGHAPAKPGGPPGRTGARKGVSPSAGCNGEDSEVLTNGFVTSDPQGSPSPIRGPSAEDGFADFASFSNCEGTQSRQADAPLGEDAEDADRPPGGAAPQPPRSVCTDERPSPSGTDAEDEDESGEAGTSDGKSSETETSLGRPLSADALDEYGDAGTPGSAPSPPLQGEAATPTGDDRDYEPDQNSPSEPAGAEQQDDFGDFGCPDGDGGGGTFADFPSSESFGNFSSATEESGWSAFQNQNQDQDHEEGGESWAAFSSPPSAVATEDGGDEDRDEAPIPAAGGTELQPVAPSGRLEKLFLSSFPSSVAQEQGAEPQVETLKVLLEPRAAEGEEPGSSRSARGGGGVWTQLQDVQEAVGLRHQWGGSHCNKALLCCLGIDTRNILFTGQRKQPVIVPMYAAGLGMLQPTKEPVKPVSAAEMIASIAQTPPAAAEAGSCGSDAVQEALPPVQFDWSSSGLTNPLDGVDPELFELTTAQLDPGGAGGGGRVADAFARLMSTMEKTSTSTRKPRKDEHLSAEAAAVMAALPDLSFMQAKVLMFPATLTPRCSQATPD